MFAMYLTRGVAVAVMVAASATLLCSAAYANPDSNQQCVASGSGNSSQCASWDTSSRKLYLGVTTSTGMLTTKCQDSMLDWRVTFGHYDARVVRVCQPGGHVYTDPGGDGYWEEPADWNGTAANGGMRAGGGYVIEDTYANGGFAPFNIKPYAGTFGGQLYPSNNGIAPRTGPPDYFARVRTLYQDGHTASWDPTPQTCFNQYTAGPSCSA